MAIDYRVPGLIVPVRQPSGMSCWAAMYTMMYSWKNQVSLSIETAVSRLGPHYLEVFRSDTGLAITENRRLAEVAGLVAEPLQNWSIDGWAGMLRRYGLLWTSYAWRVGNRSGRHIIIFYGLRDGGALGQLVLYVDPGDAQFHEMPFSQAVSQHELAFTGAPLGNAELGQFSQVIHYPL